MSVQHRSRIKSVINYTSNISDMGACCRPVQDAEPYASSYQDCIEENGYFIPTELDGDGDPILDGVECPSISDTGCCCACAYVPDDEFDDFAETPGTYEDGTINPNCGAAEDNCYQEGMEDRTKCECDRRKGIWAGPNIACSTLLAESLCTNYNAQKDVRWPGACCVDGICNDACDIDECVDLQGEDSTAEWRPYTSCYNPENECTYEMRNASRDRRTDILVVRQKPTISDRIIQRNSIRSGSSNISSCCVYLNTDNNTTCDHLSATECLSKNGIQPGVDSEGDRQDCTSTACQEATDYLTNNKKIDASYVDNWKLGQYVFGGRFVGVFNVKSPSFGTGSVCMGNPNTGSAIEYIPETTDTGINSSTKFAVICANANTSPSRVMVDPGDYKLSQGMLNSSSFWDSLKNKNYWNSLNLQRTIDSKSKTTHLKWTLPSAAILSFMFKQMEELDFMTNSLLDNTIYKYTPMSRGYYWSNSSFKTKLDSKVYAYVQGFGPTSLGMVAIQPISDVAYSREVLLIPIK